MESVGESWIFAVFMSVLVLMLIIRTIRDYRARRNLPTNPEDKRINRKIAFDNLKFFLGIRGKDDSDNQM